MQRRPGSQLIPLERRLRHLRHSSYSAAMRAVELGLLAGILLGVLVLLAFSTGYGKLLEALNYGLLWSTGSPPSMLLLLFILLLTLSLLLLAGLQSITLLLSVQRLFPYYYERSLALLSRTRLPQTLATCDLQPELRLLPTESRRTSSLEQQVEIWAAYFDLLAEAPQPGSRRHALLAEGRRRQRSASLLRLADAGCVFIGCMGLLLLVGAPLLLLLAWSLPGYIASRAALCAICDFWLEEARLQGELPLPHKPQGWLALQLAPWSCRINPASLY